MTFMVIVAVAAARQKNLLATIMLTGVFSLLSAAAFVVLDAVDVAFTEAAVGAGISTVLFLGAIALIRPEQANVKPRKRKPYPELALVGVLGALLLYATPDMPAFGDPDSPVHKHPLMEQFIRGSENEIGVPNIVTSVLASYRGYDTLGEVAVVFTAGLGVLLLLGRPLVDRKRASS